MLTKPKGKRAERITPEEIDCHHWLGKLAMTLAIVSHELPPKSLARRTVDEFVASQCASETLAQMIRNEVKR